MDPFLAVLYWLWVLISPLVAFGGLFGRPLQEILTLLEIDVPEREPDPVANHWPLDQGLLVAGVVTLVRVAAVLGTHYPTRRPRQAHTLV